MSRNRYTRQMRKVEQAGSAARETRLSVLMCELKGKTSDQGTLLPEGSDKERRRLRRKETLRRKAEQRGQTLEKS